MYILYVYTCRSLHFTCCDVVSMHRCLFHGLVHSQCNDVFLIPPNSSRGECNSQAGCVSKKKQCNAYNFKCQNAMTNAMLCSITI